MTDRNRNQASFYLSKAEVETFHTRGFLGPYDLVDQAEMKETWKRERLRLFDRTQVAYPDAQPGTGVFNYDRHFDNEFLAGLISRPEIVLRLVSLMGPNVLCWRTEFFAIYPHHEGTGWHQADTFGAADGIPHLVWPKGSDFGGSFSAWIALTDATLENGCMQFMPGTQRTMFYDEYRGMHYEPDIVNTKTKPGLKGGVFGFDWTQIHKDPNWKPDDSQAVPVPCKAGQFILFPSTLMHASLPHLGKTPSARMSVAFRYVPTSVQIYGHMRESNIVYDLGGTFSLDNYGAVVVAGVDAYGHNKLRTHTMTNKPFVNCTRRPDSTLGAAV